MLFLSWLNSYDEIFDPNVHAREDEFVINSSVYENADDDIITAGFEVEIPNPGVGGSWIAQPNRYATLSYRPEPHMTAVEIARGRVVGVPSELGSETVQLEFICAPPDEDDVLKAFADTLRVGEVDYDPEDLDPVAVADREKAEAYDPLFYSRDASDDPTTAIAGTTKRFRWNKKTLEIELVDYTESAVTHDVGNSGIEGSLSVSLIDPPKKKSRIRLTAQWTQSAKGIQMYPVTLAGKGYIETYSWDDFTSKFPSPGTPLGDTGWHFAEAEIEHFEFDPGVLPKELVFLSNAYSGGDPDVTQVRLTLAKAQISFHLRLGFDYEQQREEFLDITMPSATQPIMGDDRTETVDIINLAALNIDSSTELWEYEDPDTLERKHYEVGDFVIHDGRRYECMTAHEAHERFTTYRLENGVQIDYWDLVSKNAAIDSRSPRFFDTDRGTRAIRHALRRLKREVVRRSQAIEVSFEVGYQDAYYFTCADSCRIEHRHLAGGSAIGKITGVSLITRGSRHSAEITMLVSVGDGTTAPTPGPEQSETDGIVYSKAFPAARVPVDAYALPHMSPNAYAVHEAGFQFDRAEDAIFDGEEDPIREMGSFPTHFVIPVDTIREEDLLTRRMSVTCEPLNVHQGIVL